MSLVLAFIFNLMSPFVVYAQELDNQVEAINTETKTELVDVKGTIELDIKFVLPIRNVFHDNLGFRLYDSEGHSVELKLENAYGSYKLGEHNSQTIEVKANKLDKNAQLLNA